MGRHAEWRKHAKKSRRKRMRQTTAKELKEAEREKQRQKEMSPSYSRWCTEQEELELFREQEELRIARENQEHWLQVEKEAQKQWRELQVKLDIIREERLRQEERIREEWKREQQKLEEIREKNQKQKEQLERKQQKIQSQIDTFISFGGEMPEELNASSETNPGRPACPFFSKTGACRFRDSCSRNHIKPTASNILLIPSFYSHFSLVQSADSEYGSDLQLEYEDREMYCHFREFYRDILPEFEKFGYINTVKVCSNKELHLRGNVYVEYSEIREALRAYRVFQGRWYGGRQLNVEFCNIPSWKSAICGLNFNNKCPKGSTCNFLHVFTNPENHKSSIRSSSRSYKNRHKEHEEERNWRWSESPERVVVEKENFTKKKSSKRKSDCDYRHSEKRKCSRSRSKSRSKPHRLKQ